jgi:hypothetical protein
MKQINGIKIVALTALMVGCNLFAAAKSRNEEYQTRCEKYGCTFARYNDHYSFIQANRLPQHDWEKPEAPEKRHIEFIQNQFIPFCNTTSNLTEISNFILSHEGKFPVIRFISQQPIVTVEDQDHAHQVLADSARIFKESKKFGCPIVVDEVSLNLHESSTNVELTKPDGGLVESIISKLAKIRAQKDSDFGSILRHIALVRVGTSEGASVRCIKFRDACIRLFDNGYVRPSSLPSAAPPVYTDETMASNEDDDSEGNSSRHDGMIAEIIPEQGQLPRVRRTVDPWWWSSGFFSGAGLSLLAGLRAYASLPSDNGGRVASGFSAAAAFIAFMFARYNLAQCENGDDYWQGMQYGAAAGGALGAGLLLAHDTPAVQKLLAMTARMS